MKTIDFSYFIERYISNEMNEAEKNWFTREIEGNQALREEVELRKRTEMVFQRQDILRLRSKLSEIEKNRERNVPVKVPSKRISVGIAATITILVILGSVTLFTNHKPVDQILSQVYKPYDGLSVSRSSRADVSDDYATGMDYYNIHDYRNAALYFNKVLRNHPDDMASTMFYGTSNFETRNFPEAKSSFSKVIVNNNNLFVEDAKWYLALCYVNTNEKKIAIDQLTAIKNSKSLYSKSAGRILKTLK